MTAKPEHKDILSRIQKMIEQNLKGSDLRVKVKVRLIKEEDDWLYVLVEPEKEPSKPFRFYEALAKTESALRDKKVYVALVPTMTED